MGWYGSSNWRTPTDASNEYIRDISTKHTVVEKTSKAGGRHVWLVIENRLTQERFIGMLLIERRGSDKSWMVKSMDESMQPCFYDCPVRFFDMVPETSHEWREKVISNSKKGRVVFNVNDFVTVFGRSYQVIGRLVRSYLIKSCDTGRIYKTTAKNMTLDNTTHI